MTGIGIRIKELREEKELTMDMLVTDMNFKFSDLKLNKSMLSRWEKGLNDPSLEYAKYLSLYFDVSVDYLIGITDVKTPSRLLAIKNKKVR